MGFSVVDDEHVRGVPARALLDRLEVRMKAPGFDAGMVPRTACALASGQFLLMPADGSPYAGVKVVTVAPDNPAQGMPRIQGAYLLFDAATLAPVAMLDAAELTATRTAAVSALALRHLVVAPPSALGIVGTGVQAWSHLRLLAELGWAAEVLVVGRRPEATAALVDRARGAGIAAHAAFVGDLADVPVVVCCTSSREPVLDTADVATDAAVVAVGTHDPDAAELTTELVGSADVVVESQQAARAEAGEVVQGLASGDLRPEQVIDLGAVVRGEVRLEPGRRRIFKSVGMSWEDLVVATAVLEHESS